MIRTDDDDNLLTKAAETVGSTLGTATRTVVDTAQAATSAASSAASAASRRRGVRRPTDGKTAPRRAARGPAHGHARQATGEGRDAVGEEGCERPRQGQESRGARKKKAGRKSASAGRSSASRSAAKRSSSARKGGRQGQGREEEEGETLISVAARNVPAGDSARAGGTASAGSDRAARPPRACCHALRPAPARCDPVRRGAGPASAFGRRAPVSDGRRFGRSTPPSRGRAAWMSRSVRTILPRACRHARARSGARGRCRATRRVMSARSASGRTPSIGLPNLAANSLMNAAVRYGMSSGARATAAGAAR